MHFSVDEVIGEKDHPIALRLKGEDINFLAQNGILSVYLDEDTAESIAFHIQSIIQLREKDERNSPKS